MDTTVWFRMTLRYSCGDSGVEMIVSLHSGDGLVVFLDMSHQTLGQIVPMSRSAHFLIVLFIVLLGSFACSP